MSLVTTRRSSLVMLMTALSGCAALDLATRQAPQLYELSPKSTFPAELPFIDQQMVVETPTATAGLNTTRIALKPTPTNLDYYANATWTEVLPVMVRNRLVESFDNAGKIDATVLGSAGVAVPYALLTNLREFQAEYNGDTDMAPVVNVVLQARLVTLPRRDSIAAVTVSSSVSADSPRLADIVTAFDRVFGDVQKDLVIWALGELETVA